MNHPTPPVGSELSRLTGDPIIEGGAREGADINLQSVIVAFRRRLDVFIMGFFAVLVVALAVIFQLTPRYTATAQILIDPRQKEVLDFEAVLSGLPPDSAVVDTEVEILRSEALARKVSQRLGLQADPEFNPDLREPGRLGRWASAVTGLFGGVARAAGATGDAGALTPAEAEADALEATYRVVGERLRARRVGLTYLIELGFETETPAKAAAVANAFAEAYIERQLEAKFDATRRANDWLSERLGALRAEVESAERQVEAYRAEAGLIAAEGSTLVEAQITDISTQLVEARADLTEKQARLSSVQGRLSRGEDLEAIGEALASDVVRDLRRQQAEVVRRRAELESELGPRHPTMVSVNRELSDLEAQIDAEVRRIVRNLENEVAIMRGRVSSLERSLGEAESEMLQSNRALVRLRELERGAEASRALYESFLNRFKQTSEQEGIEEADAQIVSQASVPREPSFPRRNLLALVTLVAAAGFGAALVVLAEIFDNGFRVADELEDAVGLPVVGTIPLLSKREANVDGKQMDLADYVMARPFSVFAEAFRTMKASLVRPNPDKRGQVIVFTSGVPGEGKTVNSVSFARTLALSGTKVLAIDGDLRRRALSRTFGMDAKVGLIEVLSGEVEVDAAITEDASGADVLALSPVRYTAQDVFSSRAFANMLEQLRQRYDVVVFDTAPVLAVADTLSLIKHADVVVVMVRWARTSRSILKMVMMELRNLSIRSATLALTQVNVRANAKYGYGYYSDKYTHYYAN
ncbi:MAG: AAA family ATPase [Caulobacterales bacterium]|nr:AAA family ATPase [Caulobacterales bacterium]